MQWLPILMLTGISWVQDSYFPPLSLAALAHMQQLCQDALAINHYYGGGDHFITMTANPAWPEIQSNLFPGQHASDHPDLAVHIFRVKLMSLIKDITNGVLGEINAFLYTIEFQKHGLPHAHIIVFLKPHAKLHALGDIDSLMSSEFPDDDPELLELIKKFMVHSPCNGPNSSASCIVNGKCSKGFPKCFREETSVTEDSYACTRHRNTGQSHVVKNNQVDNQWVVCHSRYLIWKYHCHINVESIASVKAIEYIYKYVYKGHDRTTMEFGTCNDEIKQYLDACYVGSCKALWHLYLFNMQQHVPAIVRLQVHLPNQQGIVFNPEDGADLQDVVDSNANKDTTLTGWFKANAENEANHALLYQDFPSNMVLPAQVDSKAEGLCHRQDVSCTPYIWMGAVLPLASSHLCQGCATSFGDLTFDGIPYFQRGLYCT